ncbi:MAG: thioesterase family protein [Bacteroidota bacterium]
MYHHSHQLRIRYSETDQMGYVYYGNYAAFLELGRVETLRSLGISYKSLEEKGVMLPVVHFSINYKSPAKYDDLIVVKTTITQMPTAKILFDYEVLSAEGNLLADAHTMLVFMDDSTRRPIKCPEAIISALQAYYSDEPPTLA